MSKPQTDQRPPSMVSELSGPDAASGAKGSRPSGKVHSFGKRDHAIKRSPNVPVVVRGWLHKQDSSGMRLWKRRWFVLSDFCLFYYKDSREEVVLGSIPLPGYAVTPVEPDDHVSRKYAFKACHTGMRSYIQSSSPAQSEHATVRTYFFSADTQEDMNGWTRAMSQAALLQSHGTKRESEGSEKSDASEQQANHAEACSRSSSQPEREVRSEDAGRYAQEGRVVPRPPAAAATGADVPSLDLPGPPLAPFAPHTRGNGRSPAAPRREPNGHAMYKRGLWAEPDKEAQRKNVLSQVEHWVKVQKGDPKSLPSSEHVLPWRTPPTQPRACSMETYQSLPRTSQYSPGSCSPPAPRDLPSDYKYAHDRLSHFRMSPDERVASKEGMVWRLYEWQQRRQFRHGSPTAPIGVPAAGSDPFTPRSVSVPPSPSDGPPPKALSPRRPHTPAERVTVRPLDERPATAIPGCNSPRRMQSQLFKTAPADRRSMPPVGYITHTVSAPSLHGKTLEELTLLLVQLRRHQAQMAGKRTDALAHLRWGHGPSGLSLQADDTYMKLKSDLEYLDLKVTGRDTLKDRSAEPVRIAESDIDVKLSRLCEQDKTLQELETRVRMLKEDKDKLESVLDVSHQQMEQYRDQPAHVEKIAYQQRLLQEDVVHIRAEISRVTTEMENAWSEYGRLEMDLARLRESLQDQMNRSILSQQEKAQMRKELWRMEDVLAGLSSNKANYKVTIDSVKNPERKLGPSVPLPSVPSPSASTPGGEAMLALHLSPESRPSHQSHLVPQAHSAHKSVPKRMEDEAPPRPPLPQLYSPDQEAPTVPPLPKEASVVRHTSVRGLKRQSDERKRDRDTVQYVNGDYKVELRSYLSEPQLSGTGSGPGGTNVATPRSDFGSQTLPSRGLAGSTPRLNQSADISSYVTLRRGVTAPCLKVRPKSALERLCSGEPQQGGRMSAEEQLERMKRHQRALLRERKRTLSQGERPATAAHAPSSYFSSSRPLCADPGSWRREQEFDLQLLERAVRGEEHRDPLPRSRSDEWLTVHARPISERDLEPMDFQLDLSRELSKPQKVSIPERYLDTEPGEPLSRQDVEARHRKVERIKSILTKSSVGGMQPLMAQDQADGSDVDSALQEQERIITMSYALASEASLKSKEVAEQQQVCPSTASPPPTQATHPPQSNGFHYTFV